MTDSPDAPPGDLPSPALERAHELLTTGPRNGEPRGPRGHLKAWTRRRLVQTLRPVLGHQRDLAAALADAVTQLQDRVAAGELAGAERGRQARELTAQQGAELRTDVHRALAGVDRTMRAQVRGVLHTRPYLTSTPFSQFDTLVGSVIGFTSADAFPRALALDPAELDVRSFEPPDRLQPHALLLSQHAPVMDLACGEGDLLAVLMSAGVEARGVARDPDLVRRCRDRGLSAQAGDPVAHLETQPDHSLGAVFSSGIIEGLSIASRWRLLEVALRTLAPGGVFVAETLNPHSISAMRMLAMSETDQHPLFPEVALGICGMAGFSRAFVFAPGHPSFEAARFLAPRFAVVATTPAAITDGDHDG